VLKQLGLDESRLRLEWVSAAEGDKFAKMIQDFTDKLTEMGPSPLGLEEIPAEAD